MSNDPLKSLKSKDAPSTEKTTTPAIVRETPNDKPQDERLYEIWHMAYRSAIDSIYGRGLAYWNGKIKQLEYELELAVERADQTLAAYIRVRNRTPDPTFQAVQQWYKEQDADNPLA